MDIPSGLIETPAILRSGGRTDAVHSSFMAGNLVRIRRGFYVPTSQWVEAKPWDRFAWTLAAATRAIPGLVLCRETAAFAAGLPILQTPSHVECLTPHPSRSGSRRPTFLAHQATDQDGRVVRETGYPLRYHLGQEGHRETHGEFTCTGLLRTVLDVAFSSKLSQSLVVTDGAARKLWLRGELEPGVSLLEHQELAAAVRSHPHAAARHRAELALALSNPLVESAGESYSRAAFHYLGFEQPELQHDFSDLDGFIGRSDFWWPGRDGRKGVVGEFDGKGKYTDALMRRGGSPEEALYQEKIREDRIRALGFAFVRWGWSHVRDPERLRRKLISAGLSPAGKSALLRTVST